MTQKTALTVLGLSIALHVSAGTALSGAGFARSSRLEKEPIYVNYLRSAPSPKPEVSEPMKMAPEKKAVKKAPAVRGYLRPAIPVARKKTPIPAPIQKEPLMTVSDFATDPQKGRIFSSYFDDLKEKINETVKRRYAGDGEGRVTILFIVSESGKLQGASIVESQTDADLAAKTFVMDCLKKTAPFGSFPRELGAPRIAFNLTILFE